MHLEARVIVRLADEKYLLHPVGFDEETDALVCIHQLVPERGIGSDGRVEGEVIVYSAVSPPEAPSASLASRLRREA